MPRVAHVISTPAGIGGAEKVLLAIVEGGRERGWDQLILNPFAEDPHSSAIRRATPSVPYDGMPSSILGLPRLRGWLRGALRTFRPHLVHAHLFHALVALASLRREEGCSTILTHHHGALLQHQGRKFDALLDRWAGQRVDEIVAVSESVRRFLLDTYGYEECKVSCIPNGWSGEPGISNRPVSPLTVVSVANLREEKGHDLLLRAFETTRRSVPEARLVLVGGGPLASRIRSLVAELQLGESVILTGPVEDVWPFLQTSHLFVQASSYETSGLAVMEAMAAGLPVVASDVGATRELVDPGVTGDLFASGNAAQLAEKMTHLLRSAALRDKWGRSARRVASGLHIDRAVERYYELYEDMLSRTGIWRER